MLPAEESPLPRNSGASRARGESCHCAKAALRHLSGGGPPVPDDVRWSISWLRPAERGPRNRRRSGSAVWVRTVELLERVELPSHGESETCSRGRPFLKGGAGPLLRC